MPRVLYPDLWKELETQVKVRRLTLSSLYPGPWYRRVATGEAEDVAASEKRVTIDWSNFRGPKTPHEEVLYQVNGKFVGRGDEGFDRLLAILDRLPQGAAVVLPQYENRGRWVMESAKREKIETFNARLRTVTPFTARSAELDARITQRKLALSFSRMSPGLEPRTVMDWHAGDRYGQAFVTFGRIVRHDEQPGPAAAQLAWTRYESGKEGRQIRQVESEAFYTLNGAELGQGVAGFAAGMEKLAELSSGSVVQVRVCLRTKGPFLCPLIYEGQRHFERTGFEPYVGLFPWLIDVARKHHLEVQWLPDEEKSCGDCELNK